MIIMQYFIYAIVIFTATLLGAFVGLGGGVIIKPILDVLHLHSLAEISFFSSCAVFSMSVTSTVKYLKKGVSFKKEILFPLAAGAVVGGFAGNRLFSAALQNAESPELVKGVQSALLCALLLCVIIFVNSHVKTAEIKNPFGVLITGLLLGTLASFLGIGGGPINVAALTLLFSFSVRDAAVYSVAVIFFSQLSNLCVQFVGGVQGYDLKMLWAVIPCAVCGGLLGAVLNRKCSEKTARITFTMALIFMAFLTLYNTLTSFC